MRGVRILVVEDDHALAAGLVRGLRAHDFEIELLTSGADVVRHALSGRFALVVLDLMLPEQSGFEILEQLQNRSRTPVIVLTAKTGLADRLRSFDLGAVDYVSKPFWIEELVARVRVKLGMTTAPVAANRTLQFGTLAIDLDAHVATVDSIDVKLTRTEYLLLAYLAQRPDRVAPRASLATQVLSLSDDNAGRTVDAHITRLRKKLGEAGARIATVWGIGYRFETGSAT